MRIARILGSISSEWGGAASGTILARVLGRNVPLVLMLVALGILFWPKTAEETMANENAADDPVNPEIQRPNGAYRSDGLHEAG